MTAEIGNAIARKIIGNQRPNYDATLRHSIANDGLEDATRLAVTLLEITHEQARDVIQRLCRTRPDNIHKPHDWGNGE